MTERDVEILLADRALQPDREAGVDRQRLDALVELNVDRGDRPAVRRAHRDDAGHAAHERAPHVHLVPAGQLLGVADAHVQRVTRQERQSVVRLKREHDRDDHDQNGQRTDQHGAAAGRSRGVCSLPAPGQVAQQPGER